MSFHHGILQAAPIHGTPDPGFRNSQQPANTIEIQSGTPVSDSGIYHSLKNTMEIYSGTPIPKLSFHGILQAAVNYGTPDPGFAPANYGLQGFPRKLYYQKWPLARCVKPAGHQTGKLAGGWRQGRSL